MSRQEKHEVMFGCDWCGAHVEGLHGTMNMSDGSQHWVPPSTWRDVPHPRHDDDWVQSVSFSGAPSRKTSDLLCPDCLTAYEAGVALARSERMSLVRERS